MGNDIYINGRFLSQPMTGIPRFGYELCRALLAAGVDFTVVVPADILPAYDLPFKTIQYGKLKSHLWEQIDLFLFLKSRHNPLLISFSGLGPVFYKNHIATIHDLVFIRHPQWFSKMYCLIYKILTPIVVRNAKKIITVSNASKQEIITLLKTNPDKITVVYNALSDTFLHQSPPKPDQSSGEKYILALSSINPRKNFLRIIRAFRELNMPGMKLYVAGATSGVFNPENACNQIITDDVRILGHLNDRELSDYYRHAQLLIFPSLHEGFGVPPLEAQANGCPVVVSDIPALKEIYGDSVAYCNPCDVSSIVSQMKNVLEDEALRNDLIRKGYKKTHQYSWTKSAQKVVDCVM
ncbi:MAG: glycosyltransferase family 4 protein [Dysgonamonadaceae bacterium]|jgi:glycosyltransferase involved in cell wall biosynthesis|nr:glycosyltransferase family 4 protein [Dysgonamonadaceae bacterium]